MNKLTGRKRYRVLTKGFIFKTQYVVLQVEYIYSHMWNELGSVETEERTDWRDAYPEEVMMLNER